MNQTNLVTAPKVASITYSETRARVPGTSHTRSRRGSRCDVKPFLFKKGSVETP